MSDTKTNKLVDVWREAERRVSRAESEAVAARNELRTAKQLLGEWLTPQVGFDDASTGKEYSIWVDGVLISVQRINSEFEVKQTYKRKEPELTVTL